MPGENLGRAFQRSGALFKNMASFGKAGEFLQARAVTRNLMASDKIFAIDTETGDLLWVHDGGRIANITLVLGDGKIFFAESTITERQKEHALEDRRELIGGGTKKKKDGIF